MTSFTKSIQNLISLVTRNPHLESAWLSTLGHMEHLAAEQIMGNISKSTPREVIAEIENHANDEYRHRDTILAIRPHAEPLNEDYRLLRLRLRDISESFVMGYFANPLLVQAKSRFAAYVHGAITIEQFPFQIYSSYIEGTQDPVIKKEMEQVLSEEVGHITLGKKLREMLSEEDHLSLQQLQVIEKDMCLKMVLRMTALIQEFLGEDTKEVEAQKPSSRLLDFISSRPYGTIAWTYALAHGESTAALHMQRIYTDKQIPCPAQMAEHVNDEMRHSLMLQRCLLLDRRPWNKQEAYKKLEKGMIRLTERYLLFYFSRLMKEIKDPDMLYLYGAWGLEMRVFKHYNEYMRKTDHVLLAHTISTILSDEAEHTQMVHDNLSDKGLLDPEIIKFVRQVEEEVFEDICSRAQHLLERMEQEGHFTPPYQTKTIIPNFVPSKTEFAELQ